MIKLKLLEEIEMKRTIKAILISLLIITMYGCSSVSDGTWQEHYDLGIKHLADGKYEEAIIEFTAAIKIDNKLVPAYIGRGDSYFAIGGEESFLNAMNDYENALKIEPQINDESYINLARIYIYFENSEKAVDILSKFYDDKTEINNFISGETLACLFEKNALKAVDLDEFRFLEKPCFDFSSQDYAKMAFSDFLANDYDILTVNHDGKEWVEARKKGDHEDIPIFWSNQHEVLLHMNASRMKQGGDIVFEKRDLGFNSIHTMDSAESVLNKLGVDNATELWKKIVECRKSEIDIRDIWINGMKVQINTSTTNNGDSSTVVLWFYKDDKVASFDFIGGKLHNVGMHKGNAKW